ncbi:hypothetical protein ACG94X_14785 [Acinetobacter sp. ULE_I010]
MATLISKMNEENIIKLKIFYEMVAVDTVKKIAEVVDEVVRTVLERKD